jgi:hypothetical protein
MSIQATDAASAVMTAVAGEIQARASLQLTLIKESLQAQARLAELLQPAGLGENIDLHV